MLGSATAASYERSLPVVLADPGIDAAIVLFVPPVAVEAEDVGRAISTAAAESDGTKPVLASILAAAGAPPTLRDATSVPSFAYPEAAAGALGRARSARRRGFADPPGACRTSRASTRHARRLSSRRALETEDELWLEPDATRGASSSPTACPSSRSDIARHPTRPSPPLGDRLPGRREDRSRRRAQDRARRRRARARRPRGGPRSRDAHAARRCSSSATSATASSFSPASRTTPCSARSSRSAPAGPGPS